MKSKRYFMLLLLMLTAVAVSGCKPTSDPVLDLIDTDLKKTKVDDLSRTMGFVLSERRYSQKEYESTVSSGLNRWINYAPESVTQFEWSLDPKIKPLMESYPGVAILDRTSELSFVNLDAYYLLESSWVQRVVKRVTESDQISPFELYRLAAEYKPAEDTEDPVVELMKRLHPNLPTEEAEQLTRAFKYFDWIIRNVQLNEEFEPTEDEVEQMRLNDNDDPVAAGVPSTGYRHYPWQTLLYGRGDYVDRAKLFMVGLQQNEIDSVMLSVKQEDGSSRPWLVAVAIGKEYYLFDPKLGLPLPGSKLGSFATLSDVRENEALLKGLDLTNEESLADDTQYWVKPDQVKELTGLVYVAPEAVSKRMKGLEMQLIGEDRIPLVVDPSAIVDRLPEVDGLKIEIWDNAFKTHQFRQAVREALEDKENNVITDRLGWYFENESYIANFPRYRTSRARFFAGNFESPRNDIGFNAIESFNGLMYTDETVDSLATDPNLQRGLGILTSAGQNAADFDFQVRSVQSQMRLVRRDTGLFLAQSHFDNGSETAAANWLLVLKEEEDADRWVDGISYLLGRAYESRKEYDLAVEEYKSTPQSRQVHGNLIRVRMLNTLIDKLLADTQP